MLASGAVDPAWPANGRALCTANAGQFEPKIVSDGAHGAIVTWYDARTGANHVFAQHVLASGAVDPAWPVNGRGVSDGALTEEFPRLVPDGAGGAIVTWQARSNGILAIFAQHLVAGGVTDPAWPAGGRPLGIPQSDQTGPAIASDGAGGAVLSWMENLDILAQHVLSSGALDPTYPAAGRAVCRLPSQQRDPVLVATGGGGAIVTWTDTRIDPATTDIFALQVLAAGTVDVPPAAEAPGIVFSRPSPNPASGPLALRFTLRREAHVRLAVFDAGGRRVRDLFSGTRSAGEHSLQWDLRDGRGRGVGAGLYFAVLEAEGRTLAQRIVALD